MARIYISSTYEDLHACREIVHQTLRKAGHDVVAMEDYVATDRRPLDKCLTDVASCDLYVGIVAHRYGFRPDQDNPERRSVTELEYEQARRQGIDCLLFVLDDEAAWRGTFMDSQTGEGDGGAFVRRLRDRVCGECTVEFFTGPQDLATKVIGAAALWCSPAPGPGDPRRFTAALERYRTWLVDRYRRLDLDALTPPQREEHLQIELRQVFVEQDTRADPPPVELPKTAWEHLRAAGEARSEGWVDIREARRAEETYLRKPRRNVIDVLTGPSARRIVLLGDPGSGKSTLARYLVLSAVEPSDDERLRDAFDGHLPLLVELRVYAGLRAERRCDNFLEFFDYLGHAEGCGLEHDALRAYLDGQGPALVVFDGLDEVFDPGEREAVARHITGFSTQYPHTRVVVTSRVIGYQRGALAGFAHHTLQDLDRDQINAFADRWYALALHDRPQEIEQRRERLRRAVDASPSIRELAGNPLLLTMLAIVGKHQELPRERVKLYDHAASVLVEHWDVNKHLHDARLSFDYIDEDDKRELLRRVAVRMQRGGEGQAGNRLPAAELHAEFEGYLIERYELSRPDAKKAADVLIDRLRIRNFVLSSYGAGLYGFVHRAFLEYFCAQSLALDFGPRRQLNPEQLRTEVFGAHWRDESWHEVLRLLAGMLDERFAGEIAAWLATEAGRPWPARFGDRPARDVTLAAQCLTELRNLSAIRSQAEAVLMAVADLLEHLARRRDDEAVKPVEEALAPVFEAIGRKWPGRDQWREWFATRGLRIVGWLSQPVPGRLLGLLFADDPTVRDELHQLAAEGPGVDRRLNGLAGLVAGWPGDEATLALLRDRLRCDPSPRVRAAAVRALADRRHGNDETRVLLREALDDLDATVRQAAVEALVERCPKEPETAQLLLRLVSEDNADEVRRAVLRGLTQLVPAPAALVATLRERACLDPDGQTRAEAVRALAETIRDQPGMCDFLREHAVADPSGEARGAALQALAETWPDDETVALLRDRATEDPDGDARAAALRALARGWRDEPDMSTFLRSCATQDEHGSARAAALDLLATHWRDDAEVSSLVLDRCVTDPEGSVRASALRSAVRAWPREADVSALLRDRVIEEPNEGARQQAVWLTLDVDPSEDVLIVLQRRAVEEPMYYVRTAIVQTLAQGWPDDPRTLPLLRQLAVEDSDETVRPSALEAIVRGWSHDPATLPFLRERSSADPITTARNRALEAVAKGWPYDPETRNLLRDLTAVGDNLRGYFVDPVLLLLVVEGWPAEQDSIEPVIARLRPLGYLRREQAFKALPTSWRNEPGRLPWVRNVAESDPSDTVRRDALVTFVRYSPDHSGTRELLRERATHDPSPSVRQEALRLLTRSGADQASVTELLRDRMLHDPDDGVRGTALRLLQAHLDTDALHHLLTTDGPH
ncbi:MAG: HEAT repeat domain-containing protein [Egibacteraceae bacterium]